MSGGVMEIAISAIIIESRYRRDMGDIAALAKSIEQIGLLHPVVLDMDHRLIAGQRRIEAFKLLGRETIPVRILDIENIVLGEHAENELRKDFTPSERVAIGEEVERVLGNRRGQRTAPAGLPQNFAEVAKGAETAEVAAKRAGFGNKETYRQAKAVVKSAEPAVVEAMDKNELSVNAAFKLSKLPVEEQAARAAIKRQRPFAHIRKLTDELALAAHKANMSDAGAQMLSTLPAGEQRELARDPRAMKGRLGALRMEERQKSRAAKEQMARNRAEYEAEDAFVIGKIIEALVAANFDRETQRRICRAVSLSNVMQKNLCDALPKAFGLLGEDTEAARAAALGERANGEASEAFKALQEECEEAQAEVVERLRKELAAYQDGTPEEIIRHMEEKLGGKAKFAAAYSKVSREDAAEVLTFGTFKPIKRRAQVGKQRSFKSPS